jgi:hypothetical protein
MWKLCTLCLLLNRFKKQIHPFSASQCQTQSRKEEAMRLKHAFFLTAMLALVTPSVAQARDFRS